MCSYFKCTLVNWPHALERIHVLVERELYCEKLSHGIKEVERSHNLSLKIGHSRKCLYNSGVNLNA